VPDCEALNTVLVEENMHPDPDTNIPRPKSIDQPKYSLSSCQSPMRRRPLAKIYIQTIARYITALVAQIQWLELKWFTTHT